MKSWLALPVFSLALLTSGATAEVVERVVAKVGGDIITLSEFTNRQVAAAQAARIAPDKVATFMGQNNARIMQDAIDELLLVQRASDLGLRLRPEYVDEVIEGIKKDNKIETEEDFNARLRAEGLTLTDLKRNIERSILRNQVIRKEVDPKITISDAEARADYEKRKADYTKPATVHLQEMLIAGSVPASVAKANELAEAVRAGGDFLDLAKKNSTSPTAATGGDLGDVPAADLAPTLARESAKLKPGEVSEPFADAGGYRIVRLVGRKAEEVTSFENARQDVINQLMRPRFEQEYDKYIAGLRQAAQPTTQIMVREVPTEVSISGEGSILSGTEGSPATPSEAPAPQPGTAPAAPADPDAEISTTPQAAPQRVAPAPVATPTPTPTPTPKP